MDEVVTPILMACGVPLQSVAIGPRWIDIPHLRHALTLDHWLQNEMHVYNFDHPEVGAAKILLPCIAFTRILEGSNTEFSQPIQALYDAGGGAQHMEVSKEEDEPMEEVEYDARRYHFEEHPSPTRESNSLPEAHKRIGMLQTWNKAHEKVMKSCLKTIKSLKEMLNCSSSTIVVTGSNPPE